eukprot:COSAG03_NODE_2421_length_2791_cov_94.742571_2_plen_77_part_00
MCVCVCVCVCVCACVCVCVCVPACPCPYLCLCEQAPQKLKRGDGSQAQMGGHEHIAALLEGVLLARAAAVGAGKEL